MPFTCFVDDPHAALPRPSESVALVTFGNICWYFGTHFHLLATLPVPILPLQGPILSLRGRLLEPRGSPERLREAALGPVQRPEGREVTFAGMTCVFEHPWTPRRLIGFHNEK